MSLVVQPRPEDVETAEVSWARQKRERALNNTAASVGVGYCNSDVHCNTVQVSTPPFLRNAAMVFLLHSGWSCHTALPSNASILYTRRNRATR